MRPCEDCTRARRDVRGYRVFNPACPVCGGRILWMLQRLRIPEEHKVTRLRAALADWVAHGHPEQQLRELSQRNWIAWANGND